MQIKKTISKALCKKIIKESLLHGFEFPNVDDVNKMKIMFFIKDNTEFVGATGLFQYSNLVVVDYVFVKPNLRKMGLASNLIKSTINHAIKNNIKCLYLFTKIPDFFSKFGFKVIIDDEIILEFEKHISRDTCQICEFYQKSCFPIPMMLKL